MLLSIIIPVYNSDRYLSETLKSIFIQDCIIKFEIIIVNDGSNDKSEDIIESYRKGYTNIKYIKQDNKGLSCARNSGLEVAQGDYIWFIDSDDTIPFGVIKQIIQIIQNKEIEIYGFDILKTQEQDYSQYIERIITKSTYYKYYNEIRGGDFFENKLHHGIVQRYIYNRNFLNSNNLRFYPKIKHEDMLFTAECFIYAHKIRCHNFIIYNYLIRKSGNIMSNITRKNFDDIFTIISILTKRKENTFSQSIKCIIDNNVFNLIYTLIKRQSSYRKEYTLNNKQKYLLLNQFVKSYCNIATKYGFFGKTKRLILTIFRIFKN